MDSHYVHIPKECCICLICESESKEQIIKLDKNEKYYKKCNCNPSIHTKCLETWLVTKSVCPICHSKYERRKTICEKISSVIVKICSHVETAVILMLIIIIVLSYSTHS